MFPVLFSIGPVTIFSYSVFLILSWLVFSFLFWRQLRSVGIEEDRIFDLTFYATLVGCIVARIGFVLLNWELFEDSWLKIVAIWVQPGLWLYGGLVGAVMTLVSMSRSLKVRVGHVLDGLAMSIPQALLIGQIGSFLDGSVVGTIADLPWAVRYVGHVGRRHPVQLYESIVLLFVLILLIFWQKKGIKHRWPYGLLGVRFFIVFAAFLFPLEFVKDTRVYWALRANQWVQIAMFAEGLGAFYVRGGGREGTRAFFNKLRLGIGRTIGGIHAKFSKRNTV